MSKLSFRARNLDSTRRMPVYQSEELTDLAEYASINRSVPQMPTGMEKEEEMEFHLQQAINARLTTSLGTAVAEEVKPSSSSALIPIPKFENAATAFHLYQNNYRQPKQLIRVQASLSLAPEFPDYNLDDDDERWIAYTSERLKLDMPPLQFEKIMDTLEKQSEYKVISADDAKWILQEDDDIVFAVYDYWLNKKYKFTAQGRRLIPQVRGGRRNVPTTIADPYVGFRRRAEKMQTRKNRKNDEESYERILKLRQDLQKALTLLEMVKRREKSKRELIKLSLEISQKRWDTRAHLGEDMYEQLRHEVKPSFQFSKEEMLVGRTRHRSNKRRRQGEDRDLVSREWLVENAEQWHKPALFPSRNLPSSKLLSPPRLSAEFSFDLKQQRNLPGTDKEADTDADGLYAWKRRRGCVYLAPVSASPSPSDTKPRLYCGLDRFDRKGNFTTTNNYYRGRAYAKVCLPSRFEDDDSMTKTLLHLASTSTTSLSDQPHQKSMAINGTCVRFIGLARRRLGRGGRIMLDRLRPPPKVDSTNQINTTTNKPSVATARLIDSEHSYYHPVRRPPLLFEDYSSPFSTHRVASSLLEGPRGRCRVDVRLGVRTTSFSAHNRLILQHEQTEKTLAMTSSSSSCCIECLDTRRAFEATAAVMSVEQMRQLARRYERTSTARVPTPPQRPVATVGKLLIDAQAASVALDGFKIEPIVVIYT